MHNILDNSTPKVKFNNEEKMLLHYKVMRNHLCDY